MIIVNKLCVLSNKLSKRATAGDAIARDELVHVLVDTALRNDKLKVRAYTTRAVDDPLQRREHTQYLAEKKRRESGKTKKAHAQGTGKSAKARRRRRNAANREKQKRHTRRERENRQRRAAAEERRRRRRRLPRKWKWSRRKKQKWRKRSSW